MRLFSACLTCNMTISCMYISSSNVPWLQTIHIFQDGMILVKWWSFSQSVNKVKTTSFLNPIYVFINKFVYTNLSLKLCQQYTVPWIHQNVSLIIKKSLIINWQLDPLKQVATFQNWSNWMLNKQRADSTHY